MASRNPNNRNIHPTRHPTLDNNAFVDLAHRAKMEATDMMRDELLAKHKWLNIKMALGYVIAGVLLLMILLLNSNDYAGDKWTKYFIVALFSLFWIYGLGSSIYVYQKVKTFGEHEFKLE